MTSSPPRRFPGFLNLAVAGALLLFVLAIALRAANLTTPAIAEFAPEAQQVREAPPEQTSVAGAVPGGLAPGAARPSPSPTPAGPPSGVRLLRCVGDPPRQIEDPQSPPCVPYWRGANGGSTARGVSPTSVTVYWVYQGSAPVNSTEQTAADAFQRFFNDRFEFYNRGLSLQVEFGPNGDNPSMVAAADDVVAHRAFASAEYTNQGGFAYNVELATHHVISITGFESNPGESQLAAYEPYLWSYTMSGDRMLASLARWYCSVLNGRTAAHAGAPLDTRQRKLAVIYDPGDKGWQTDLSPLRQGLAGCGVSPLEIDDADNTMGSNAVLQMSSRGVTTAICVCWYANWASNYTYPAASENYAPEWILSSYGGGDTQAISDNGGPPPQESATTFGLTFQPRQVTLVNDPMWWAWSEGDPGAGQPTGWGEYYQMHLLYRSLLEIASGIQMAGPDLTALSFQSGLQHALFPDPETPIEAGAVDFFGGSHAMTVDAAQWWWSNEARSPWAGQGDTALGAICYVEHGRRYQASSWQPGMPDELMSGPCDSGA